MGFSSCKIHGLSLLAACAASALCQTTAFAAGEEAGTSALLKDFVLPEYHKGDNRLQCIVYGDQAVNEGAFIKLKNPLLDIVHDHIRNINDVANLQGAKLYLINASTADALLFWKDKKHSRALIGSPSAVYDRTTKMLRGDEKVSLRTEGLEIDGVGFDANEETRFIHIRSKVVVIIRPEMRKSVEPAKAKAPATPEPTNSGKEAVK